MMQAIAQWFQLHLVDDFVDKCKLKEQLSLLTAHSTLLHIEQCRIVELTYSTTVCTLHIIGINLQHRLGEHAGCLRSSFSVEWKTCFCLGMAYSIFLSYALSLVIPRAGEFARCGVLKKWDDVSFPKALGTVVTERAIDSLLVLLITALVFVMVIPNSEDGDAYDQLRDMLR